MWTPNKSTDLAEDLQKQLESSRQKGTCSCVDSVAVLREHGAEIKILEKTNDEDVSELQYYCDPKPQDASGSSLLWMVEAEVPGKCEGKKSADNTVCAELKTSADCKNNDWCRWHGKITILNLTNTIFNNKRPFIRYKISAVFSHFRSRTVSARNW